VLRSVGLWCVSGGVDEGMHEEAGAECVEIEYVEDAVVVHEGLCVSVNPFFSLLYPWGDAAEESNDFFVDDVKGLEVCFVWVWVSPDGDVRDEVWVCEGVVELDKSFAWEDFVEMFECVDKGLEFPDDVGDVVVEFEVVLEDEAEEFGVWFVF
jgi:hypothetical protein